MHCSRQPTCRCKKQDRYERRGIPDAAADETMELIIAHAVTAYRHRLEALAIHDDLPPQPSPERLSC